jgi:hypothetical protein
VFSFVNLLTKAVATSFQLKRIFADGEQTEFSWKPRAFKRSWTKDDEPLRRLGEFLHAYPRAVFGGPRNVETRLTSGSPRTRPTGFEL